MVLWPKASQRHEVFCSDPEVMSLIPVGLNLGLCSPSILVRLLKVKIFVLGQWYSCRGLALVANSGVSALGLKPEIYINSIALKKNYKQKSVAFH